jgi:hypothetical protein
MRAGNASCSNFRNTPARLIFCTLKHKESELKCLPRTPLNTYPHDRGCHVVDPVPDALLLRKSGSAGNPSRTSGSVGRNSDH